MTIALTSVMVAVPLHADLRQTAHPGARLRLMATAYCQDGTTRSGTHTRSGIVAADPRVLPVGSVLKIDSPKAYAGIYTVMDTGEAIDGNRLDIFMPDCRHAKRFGRQQVRVRILRHGWDPKASDTK